MQRKFVVTVTAGPKTYIVEAENYEEAFSKAIYMLCRMYGSASMTMTSTWKIVWPGNLTLSMENIRRENSHACVHQPTYAW